jgi:hypothetical protein
MRKKQNDSERIAQLMCGLEDIWLSSIDYDGETTIKGLKGLIDELKDMSVKTMFNERQLPKKFKSWTEYAKARGFT